MFSMDVCNIWSVQYLHDNILFFSFFFFDDGSRLDISPFGENCELPWLFLQPTCHKEKNVLWGVLGGSNGRLDWLSSAVAVETKQMNCEMYSKRLETSACQHPLHLSSSTHPLLFYPLLSSLWISPSPSSLFLSDTLHKKGMTALLCLSKILEKEKCNFLRFQMTYPRSWYLFDICLVACILIVKYYDGHHWAISFELSKSTLVM